MSSTDYQNTFLRKILNCCVVYLDGEKIKDCHNPVFLPKDFSASLLTSDKVKIVKEEVEKNTIYIERI